MNFFSCLLLFTALWFGIQDLGLAKDTEGAGKPGINSQTRFPNSAIAPDQRPVGNDSKSAKSADTQIQDLLDRIGREIDSIFTPQPDTSTALGGVILRHTGRGDPMSDPVLRKLLPMNTQIDRGWVAVGLPGPLYYLPVELPLTKVVVLQVDRQARVEIISVTDQTERIQYAQGSPEIRLGFELFFNKKPIHLYQSTSEHKVIVISSAQFPVQLQPAASALLPHQQFSREEYQMLFDEARYSRPGKPTICRWLFHNKIIDYNMLCTLETEPRFVLDLR